MSYADMHLAWQQRVAKENRAKDWFFKKAFLPKSNKQEPKRQLKRGQSTGTLLNSVKTEPLEKVAMWSSNPKKFGETVLRQNDQTNTMKTEYGYIADNSYVNASDPNSILDRPGVPRSFQVYKLSNGKITRDTKFGQQ